MSVITITTTINYHYLMNKSKHDMANLALMILDAKCDLEEENARLRKSLRYTIECLDDRVTDDSPEMAEARILVGDHP